jgi:eukaryotic-like serine/threonine-protein kinase
LGREPTNLSTPENTHRRSKWLIFILILVSFAALNAKSLFFTYTSEPSNKINLENISTSTKFLKYVNLTYKFEIRYPDNWKLANLTNQDSTIQDPIDRVVNKFQAPSEKKQDISLEILEVRIEDLSQPTTLDAYTTTSIEAIIKFLPKASIIDSIPVVIDNSNAHKVVYICVQNERQLKKITLWTIKNSKAYSLTFTSEMDKFDLFKETVERMMQSFKVF